MTDAEFINERLAQLYGNEVHSNLPRYRVVRSEEQTEKRYGKYDLLTQETGIWLGVKQGLVEIKKYWYLHDCWLLERLELNTNRKDTIYEKWTYEPIYPFLDNKNVPLPLVWKVIDFIVARIERAAKGVLTETDHYIQEEKRMEQEYREVYAELDKPDPIKPLPTFKVSTLVGK